MLNHSCREKYVAVISAPAELLINLLSEDCHSQFFSQLVGRSEIEHSKNEAIEPLICTKGYLLPTRQETSKRRGEDPKENSGGMKCIIHCLARFSVPELF